MTPPRPVTRLTRLTRLTRFSILAPFTLLVLFSGCSKSDGGKTPTTPAGTISLSAAPLTVALVQGGSATIALAIARTNYSDVVTLAASGVPTGVTVTFSSSSVTTNGATITIAVTSAAVRGNATILITATGTGVAAATAQLTLTVSGAPVTLTLCRNIPIWLAVQEGTSGTWRAITPTSSGVFNFDFATAIGGIAYVTKGTATADSYTLTLLYASLDQIKEFGSTACDAPGTKAVTVNVVKAAADRITVGYGPQYFFATPTRTTFPFTQVPNGPVDIVAARDNGTAAANRVVIRRGVDAPTGTTITPAIDFTSTAEGFVPDSRTVTINGLPAGDFLSVAGSYLPNVVTGAAYPIGASTTVSASTFTYPVLPAAQIIAGDFHLVSANGATADGTGFYSANQLFHTPVNTSLTLPAAPAAAAVTIGAATPYVRPRLTIARQADYNTDLFLFVTQGQTGVFGRTLTLEFTGAYFGTVATDYTLPDFTGVGTFAGLWSFKTGTAASWQLILEGRTLATAAYALKNYYIEGQVIRGGNRLGTVTP